MYLPIPRLTLLTIFRRPLFEDSLFICPIDTSRFLSLIIGNNKNRNIHLPKNKKIIDIRIMYIAISYLYNPFSFISSIEDVYLSSCTS